MCRGIGQSLRKRHRFHFEGNHRWWHTDLQVWCRFKDIKTIQAKSPKALGNFLIMDEILWTVGTNIGLAVKTPPVYFDGDSNEQKGSQCYGEINLVQRLLDRNANCHRKWIFRFKC